MALTANRNFDIKTDLFSDATISNKDSKFFAIVSNTNETETDYALLLFNELSQVPTSKGEYFMNFRLSNGAHTLIEFDTPRDFNNKNYLWSLIVENPRKELEHSRGELSQIPAQIYMSNSLTRSSE